MLYISDNQIFKKYPSSDLVTNSNIHDAKWFHYVAAYAVATLLLRGGQSPNRFGQYILYLKKVWRSKPLQRQYS